MKSKTPRAVVLVAFAVGSLFAGNVSALTVSLMTDTSPVSVVGELRHALQNTTSGGTVDFAPGLAGQVITLAPTNGSLVVSQNLVIDGTNAPGVIIDGAASASVFTVNTPATSVTFRRLTIRNGSATNGGGIYISTPCTVTVSESTIESNQVTSRGGGIYSWMGGRLNVTGSLISNNTSGSQGGGIYTDSDAVLTNTTVTGNGNTTAPIGGGGGLFAAGNLTVTHCTFYNNAAGPAGNGTYIDGIFASLSFHLINTIIDSGRGNKDCYGLGVPALITNVNNLIADGTCSPLLAVPSQVAALADNGGPTQTHALLPTSPCRDAGANASANDPGADGGPGGGDDTALSTDQRGAGFSRLVGGTVDIGAFELRIQPDNLIGRSPSPAAGLGNNLYNTSGAGQTLKLTSKQATTVRATLNVQNDCALTDTFSVRGTKGNSLFNVGYFNSATNVTAAVTTGTYATPALTRGQTSPLSIVVKPNPRKLKKRTRRDGRVVVTWLKRRISLALTSTSQLDATRKDVAKVKVKHL